MIAQFILSILLGGILFYAWTAYRRSSAVSFLTAIMAMAGLYFVWVPQHSTRLAELVGIGRGADLVLYVWVCISLILLLNVHLVLRMQMELITVLARKLSVAAARPSISQIEKTSGQHGDLEFYPSPSLTPDPGAASTQDMTSFKKPGSQAGRSKGQPALTRPAPESAHAFFPTPGSPEADRQL
jgi:hypothetical protein